MLYRDGDVGNLGGKIPGLGFSQSQQALGLIEKYFDGPSNRVNMICFKEFKFGVCPVSIPCSSSESERMFNLYFGEFFFCLLVITTQTPAVADLLPRVKRLHQFPGTFHLTFKPVLRFGHLDHTQKMIPDMSGFDKPYDVCTIKPTVREKIIKTYPFFDGPPDHINSFLDFLLEVLFNSLFYSLCFLRLPINLRENVCTLY